MREEEPRRMKETSWDGIRGGEGEGNAVVTSTDWDRWRNLLAGLESS